MLVAPIRPSEVMLDSDKRTGERVDEILTEINAELSVSLPKGGGRNDKIWVVLSPESAALVRQYPEVAAAVLSEYRDTGEWLVYKASEYQWEFYVADSPAGRHAAGAYRIASTVHA